MSGVADETLLPSCVGTGDKIVERQWEDVAFDMTCCQNQEGHACDFGFGKNFDGVIRDERSRRYCKGE